jgi:hypothetical protein
MLKLKTLASATTVALLLAGTIGQIFNPDKPSTNNSTQLASVTVTQPTTTQPTIVFSDSCPLDVVGFYNAENKVITSCIPESHPDYTEMVRHEMQHLYQDAQDGLDNYTVAPVSEVSTLQTIWDKLAAAGHPLYHHIKDVYPQDRWLVELEAYLLESAPADVRTVTLQ